MRKMMIERLGYLLAGLMVLTALGAHGQVTGVQPNPLPLYYWNSSTNSWTPCSTTSTAQPYPVSPGANAFYSLNASLGQWTPSINCTQSTNLQNTMDPPAQICPTQALPGNIAISITNKIYNCTLTGWNLLSSPSVIGAAPAFTLTTTGTSGPASYSSNVINIPNYTSNTSNITGSPYCPGVVNDGATDNTSALNACMAAGGGYYLPTTCQGTMGSIIVAGQLVGSSLTHARGGTQFYGGGYDPVSPCITKIVFTGGTQANSGFNISCSASSIIYCSPILVLKNLNITSSYSGGASASAGINISYDGSYSGTGTYSGDFLQLDQVYVSGFAQCLNTQGAGNGKIGLLECIGATSSTGKYLIDIGSGSTNSWIIDKAQGECGVGTPVAAGFMRIQYGFGNHVYIGDLGNCGGAPAFTEGYYNGSSWITAGVAEVTLGDLETAPPYVIVGKNSSVIVHWQGNQGLPSGSSSPFVMNGSGNLVASNPPDYNNSTYPLVTKGNSDTFMAIAPIWGTGSGSNNAGTTQTDVNGQNYAADTPWLAVQNNSLPSSTCHPGLAYYEAQTSGSHVLEFCYWTGSANAMTPNIFTALNLTNTSSAAWQPAIAATNGTNQSSPYIGLASNVWSTTASNSQQSLLRLLNVVSNTAQTPTEYLTLSLAANGNIAPTFGVDFSLATLGIKRVMDVAAGTKFTESGCTTSAVEGGATAGNFTLSQNSCTAIITMNGATGATAPQGWSCQAHDKTTPTVLIGGESSSTTTTASITIPSGAGTTDVISFSCTAY